MTPPNSSHRPGNLVRWLLARSTQLRDILQRDRRFPADDRDSFSGDIDKRPPDDPRTMTPIPRIRMVGINHVELDVGNVEAALFFYGKIFDLRLRARVNDAAFIDMGDQFLVFRTARSGFSQKAGHFGLVVEDRQSAMALAHAVGAIVLIDPFPSFLDPWGNRVEIVDYAQVTFLKAPVFHKRMRLNLSKAANSSIAVELR